MSLRALSISLLFALLSVLGASCSTLYDLPAPPPQDQWTSISLVPGEDELDEEKRYIEARSATLRLYSALAEEDWDGAWPLLSEETRSFLSFNAPGKDGKKVLASGQITLPSGPSKTFDPVDAFVIRDLRKITDEYKNAVQNETANRKELFVINVDENVHKVVLIREQGQWRVHRTEID